MSHTKRHPPYYHGHTFPMRGRTRSSFIDKRVQHAVGQAVAYGFLPTSNTKDLASYIAHEAKKAEELWDKAHRDGGFGRCRRKDHSKRADRKNQRAKARHACQQAILDNTYIDSGRWQDMMGTAEMFPQKW